ncbi:MAG: hypothetical protein VXY90_14070, partial [Pseudomonadota bacterium]|nr:hypothetical protein [Pseudomonadota bacterium]MEC8585892.1 hypothetical protein [Pseudomonadota bacterium]
GGPAMGHGGAVSVLCGNGVAGQSGNGGSLTATAGNATGDSGDGGAVTLSAGSALGDAKDAGEQTSSAPSVAYAHAHASSAASH